MKKISIGDIFGIDTPKGKAYFQYVYQDETIGELIRILPGLYKQKPNNFTDLVKQNELFFLYFPLKSAYKRKIVKLVGNYLLSNNFRKPKLMRAKNVDQNGKFINWHVIDTDTWKREHVTELTEEYKQLSPWGVWNDTLLIERLSTGWTLDKWI